MISSTSIRQPTLRRKFRRWAFVAAGENQGEGSAVAYGLVANGEATPAVLGVLKFVDESDRIVLEGNTAVALCVGNQVVFAQTEFTCALAGLKECGGAELGPVAAALLQIL